MRAHRPIPALVTARREAARKLRRERWDGVLREAVQKKHAAGGEA